MSNPTATKNEPDLEEESPTTIILKLKPEAIHSYEDLKANAQLRRQSPAELLAGILTKATGGAYTITPVTG